LHEPSQVDKIQNRADLFAERFSKMSFRNYQNNTRLDIKGSELKANKIKRDRAQAYWYNNVLPNHMPSTNAKKSMEVQSRLEDNEPTYVLARQPV
jgi:hypothetical protein